jgi:hypothetical protein
MKDFWLNVAAQVVATMITAGIGALFLARRRLSVWLVMRAASSLDGRVRELYRDEWLLRGGRVGTRWIRQSGAVVISGDRYQRRF